MIILTTAVHYYLCVQYQVYINIPDITHTHTHTVPNYILIYLISRSVNLERPHCYLCCNNLRINLVIIIVHVLPQAQVLSNSSVVGPTL